MGERVAESVGAYEHMEIPVDDRTYSIRLYRKVSLPLDAPRIVVVSYQGNSIARELLRICLASVERFTPEPHELWVVDNNSPAEHIDWLVRWPGINVALNRTEPLPREERHRTIADPVHAGQLNWGSYANAVGLELGIRLIDPGSHFFMTMHMDALPCKPGWLSFLTSKIHGKVAAAGVRMDTARTETGVLHVLGYMVDLRVFKRLNLDFFPELPQLDVGDRVTVKLREAGYDVFACANTFRDPELVERIPIGSPFREFQVDRSFDDDGNVFFLHLGRGVRRSSGEHRKGTSAEDWIRFVSAHLALGG